MNRFTEFELEAYASERDRLRLTAIAAEDDTMERNYGIDLPFFVQEKEVRIGSYIIFEPKITKTETRRKLRAKSA